MVEENEGLPTATQSSALWVQYRLIEKAGLRRCHLPPVVQWILEARILAKIPGGVGGDLCEVGVVELVEATSLDHSHRIVLREAMSDGQSRRACKAIVSQSCIRCRALTHRRRLQCSHT